MDNKTKKLTAAAMLSAIAFVMMALVRIPVIPAAPFLKYDPKDIVIALGGLIWGPLVSFSVSVVVSLIEMFTVSDTGIIGCVMNILSTCAFACTAAAIYKWRKTLSGAVMGLLSGVAAMAVIMLLWNYLVTPLYMGTPRNVVAGMLLPVFLPFNLLKGGLNAAFTFLLYRPVVTALRKAGFVPATAEKKKTSIGLILVSALIIVTCVLVILAINKLI